MPRRKSGPDRAGGPGMRVSPSSRSSPKQHQSTDSFEEPVSIAEDSVNQADSTVAIEEVEVVSENSKGDTIHRIEEVSAVQTDTHPDTQRRSPRTQDETLGQALRKRKETPRRPIETRRPLRRSSRRRKTLRFDPGDYEDASGAFCIMDSDEPVMYQQPVTQLAPSVALTSGTAVQLTEDNIDLTLESDNESSTFTQIDRGYTVTNACSSTSYKTGQVVLTKFGLGTIQKVLSGFVSVPNQEKSIIEVEKSQDVVGARYEVWLQWGDGGRYVPQETESATNDKQHDGNQPQQSIQAPTGLKFEAQKNVFKMYCLSKDMLSVQGHDFHVAKRNCTITYGDLARLWPGSYLNDTVVNYFTFEAFETLSPSQMEKTYLFQSYFFTQLFETLDRKGLHFTHESVARWTRKKDLFSKEIIFIPIVHSQHWSLAIVCNPGALGEVCDRAKPDKEDEDLTDSPTADQGADRGVGSEDEALENESSESSKEQASPTASSQGVQHCGESSENVQGPLSSDLKARTSLNLRNANGETGNSHATHGVDTEKGTMKEPEVTSANGYRVGDSKSRWRQCKNSRQGNPEPDTMATKKSVRPCIVFMDSLKGHRVQKITRLLRNYFQCEWNTRKNDNIIVNASNLPVCSPDVPRQSNSCDCGVFVLEYIARVLKHFEEFRCIMGTEFPVSESPVTELKTKLNHAFGSSWFAPSDVAFRRNLMLREIKAAATRSRIEKWEVAHQKST